MGHPGLFQSAHGDDVAHLTSSARRRCPQAGPACWSEPSLKTQHVHPPRKSRDARLCRGSSPALPRPGREHGPGVLPPSDSRLPEDSLSSSFHASLDAGQCLLPAPDVGHSLFLSTICSLSSRATLTRDVALRGAAVSQDERGLQDLTLRSSARPSGVVALSAMMRGLLHDNL